MPKKILIVFVLGIFSLQMYAQQREYRSEIGILGGGAYYLGDANKIPFKNMTADYGLLYRYLFDTRLSIKAEFARTSLAGEKELVTFDSSIYLLDVCGEFNFFELTKSSSKRFSKIFSPYIFLGLGALNYSYEDKNTFGMTIPFGVGFKVKLGGRWNINIMHTTRLLLKDDLEGIAKYNNPYRLNGGNFMNNDLLSTMTVGVTFDFWERKCDCRNVRPARNRY